MFLCVLGHERLSVTPLEEKNSISQSHPFGVGADGLRFGVPLRERPCVMKELSAASARSELAVVVFLVMIHTGSHVFAPFNQVAHSPLSFRLAVIECLTRTS